MMMIRYHVKSLQSNHKLVLVLVRRIERKLIPRMKRFVFVK